MTLRRVRFKHAPTCLRNLPSRLSAFHTEDGGSRFKPGFLSRRMQHAIGTLSDNVTLWTGDSRMVVRTAVVRVGIEMSG
jgi:hypothetical protein